MSVYVTAPSEEDARGLARHLLELRLAACANRWPVASQYWWRGRLEEAREHAVLLKTRKAMLPRLVAEVRKVHGHDVPCVVGWPIAGGNEDYLAWVRAEASGRPEEPRRRGAARATPAPPSPGAPR